MSDEHWDQERNVISLCSVWVAVDDEYILYARPTALEWNGMCNWRRLLFSLFSFGASSVAQLLSRTENSFYVRFYAYGFWTKFVLWVRNERMKRMRAKYIHVTFALPCAIRWSLEHWRTNGAIKFAFHTVTEPETMNERWNGIIFSTLNNIRRFQRTQYPPHALHANNVGRMAFRGGAHSLSGTFESLMRLYGFGAAAATYYSPGDCV